MDFLEKKYGDGPVREGLTDHEAVERSAPEPTLTLLYAECLRLGARLADQLGKGTEARKYRAKALQGRKRKPFRSLGATQTCYGYALEYATLSDADRAKLLARLVGDIERRGKTLTTGIFGTKFMLR
ncbi:MAG: hypothetical protein QM758_14515 [Armatimonas sp.]